MSDKEKNEEEEEEEEEKDELRKRLSEDATGNIHEPRGQTTILTMIILDCTSCTYIDESGVKCLREIIDKYKKENVKFLMTNCNGKQ